MSIFVKKKKAESPELTLVQVQESSKYDFFAALAKALLLFLLVYGALGGFLSAYEIEYNKGLCMLLLFALALLLSSVYETGKRWLINLVSILFFSLYLYIAISNYWIINSGYYAILNRFYEVARQYLNVVNGMEYSLAVEETYMTVTMFAMFLGMVGIILLNIILQSKASLFKVMLLTLTPYVIPFYFECSPGLIYMLFLFIGYICVAVLQGVNVRERFSAQMRHILPLAAVLTILVVRTVSFVFPESGYGNVIPKSAVKEATEEDMVRFAQYGMMAMFRQGSVGAGVSGGRLSKGSAVMPSYETVLKVRYTPYDFEPVYLKAFTGRDYLGDRWSQAEDSWPDDGRMTVSVIRRDEAMGYSADGEEIQGRGIMEVEKMDDSDDFHYYPYYTDYREVKQEGNVETYVYYPAVKPLIDDTFYSVDDAYLSVPHSCEDAVRKVCEEAGFGGTEEEIAAQITAYFRNNYFYTLRPGFYMGNPDYITHFLLESKRGYCAHFASAATMLFREMGVHARYVEGYAFSYLNVVQDGTLVEGAEYSDYYDGYSPIGETALVEMEIPDAYAHAWVEIYVKGRGWIVVDPTPAQTSEEDTTSFWEAFMTRNGEGTDLDMDMPASNLGEYLEDALGGISYALLGAAVLLSVGLCVVYLVRAYRESKLSGRERVRLEYGRIQTYLCRRYRDYRSLRTLREQIDWIRFHGRMEISGEQEDALYQVYFAQTVGCDCEKLYRQLRKMRGMLRYGRIRSGK